MKVNRVFVLGYFGYRTNQLDGQTVKTRDMRRLLEEQEGGVDYYDTQDFQFSRWSILRMLWKVVCCRTLVYLPAHNNLKYIFPFIFCLSRLFRFKIHYFVVGGWLREFIAKLPMHRYMLVRITGIHVETCRLKKELEEYYRFTNVDIFPNFRFFDFHPERSNSTKLRLVFMAHIMKMKGIDWIFYLADYIESNGLFDRISITFYGQANKKDREYFERCVKRFSFVEYKGLLQPEDIYGELSKYDILLLPTHYYTEGLPGSVVDAYISGIPVIVTEWKHSHEFVENGVTGYIIPFEKGEVQFVEKIIELDNDRSLLRTLQNNVLEKRKKNTSLPMYGANMLRIVFVSRIQQSKGLDILLDVAGLLQSEYLIDKVIIDFYGQKNDNYYDDRLSSIPIFSYKGVLQPSDVMKTLSQYDTLIFPTHYEGEGCPGILVEALSVGLPIIASDWKYNSEFVVDGVNGFLCPTYDAKSYLKAIKQLLDDTTLKNRMSKVSFMMSIDFSADKAMQLLNHMI